MGNMFGNTKAKVQQDISKIKHGVNNTFAHMKHNVRGFGAHRGGGKKRMCGRKSKKRIKTRRSSHKHHRCTHKRGKRRRR